MFHVKHLEPSEDATVSRETIAIFIRQCTDTAANASLVRSAAYPRSDISLSGRKFPWRKAAASG